MKWIERRLLRNAELNVQQDIDICEFWCRVANMKKGDDTAMFPLLGYFMKHLLCLPHSSATVERVFSQINLTKTKLRNQLDTSTLIGRPMLHSEHAFNQASCHNFKIKPTHLNRMNGSMYKTQDE